MSGTATDSTLEAVNAWLADHETELLADYRAMLRIPSIETEPEPNAPFGAANRAALDLALGLGAKFGMRTTDLEGFCGFADFGEGEPLILSLGHLDVVPTGPGWKHPEFGAEVDEGYVYARGAVDDKGPTIASLYAMRALKEAAPALGVRFRQVFGCDEESGFLCVERYMKTEEPPTFGVAPDSGWPLCHAEKGICNLEIAVPLGGGDLRLLEASGGQRPNIVIDRVKVRARVAPAIRRHVETKLADAWDANVAAAWDGDVLTLDVRGKAAHGSTPFMGDSAATRAFRFLFELAPPESQDYFESLLLMTHPSGVGVGIHGRDEETGDLTSNLGILTTSGETLKLLVNVRYPATWKGAEVERRAAAHLAALPTPATLRMESDSAPLFFPVDSPLVKTIVETYRRETGDMAEPFTMGGGTYARAVPNTVSIGTGWTGDGKAHETDERLKVEHLYKMSRLYAAILLSLAQTSTA